jgi:hypothetical protein
MVKHILLEINPTDVLKELYDKQMNKFIITLIMVILVFSLLLKRVI